MKNKLSCMRQFSYAVYDVLLVFSLPFLATTHADPFMGVGFFVLI